MGEPRSKGDHHSCSPADSGLTCRAARILGLTALVAPRTQASVQRVLVGSWFDENVKLLSVSPGSLSAFSADFVPSGSGGLGTPDGYSDAGVLVLALISSKNV